MRMNFARLAFAATALVATSALSAAPAVAQSVVPANAQISSYKDTSMLKPPAGVKVAILEWEDLECPACSHAYPIVHEAAKHYGIPLLERDFPLDMHIWSKQAALYSRYLHDKVSPELDPEYRKSVFAAQYRISSKDDMERFTQQFFAQHGKQMPFVVDPTGQLQREIDADKKLGDRLGINETPTIIVATQHHWIQVKDVMHLYEAIDQAEAMAAHEGAGPAAAHKVPGKK